MIVSSIESRTDNILGTDGWASLRPIEDILLSAAASESEKTKDNMRLYVGDERKRSWSEG